MKSLILVWALVLCLGRWSDAYSAYQRVTSSSSSSSSSSGSAAAFGSNYYLSPWAHAHMDLVRQLADNLRQDYNAQSRGGYSGKYSNQEWSESFANTIGKSSEELNALSRQLSQKILSDLQNGRVSYGVVAQPNYFESQAAAALEKIATDAEFIDGQQRQVELYEPGIPHMTATDLSKFDEVRHVNYPTEVKVVNGQTYITNKNCTTATLHGGSPNSPMLTTVRVNRTTTHTTVPLYINQGSSILHPFLNSQHHSIYNHLNKTEVGVSGYSPEVTVDDSVVVGMNQMNQLNTYTPPIVIPVEGGDQPDYMGIGNQYGARPGHTVTIRKYNRTIITGPDGKPIVSGSESESVWDNGKLVYKYVAPFGNVSWTKDDIWKREERERLFWLFQTDSIGLQELQSWQINQEDRILALAYRFNKTKEEIEEWQRQELDRYRALINQYNTVSSDLTEWQRNERGRIDWLIHQNGITYQDLERWQKENQQKLNILARQYRINIEDLKTFQRKELDRLYSIFNTQNSQISSNNLRVFQQEERDRLSNILLQHNSTVDQLQEQIRNDQERYKQLAEQYKLNVEDMEKFFKNELKRLTDVITTQQEEMKRITSWQQSERSRLEDILRHHNLTVEQLEQNMKYDRTYLQDLAKKYHVSLEELEKWQRAELDRLHETGKVNLQKELEVWQQQERDRMLNIIKQNHLTIEEYESKIGNDRARLQQLASIYQVQVEEVEKWLREEAQRLKDQGVFSDVQKNLTLWQQQERDRLQQIVQNNELTIEELQKKIKDDQARLYQLAHTYQVQVEDVEDWLKKELLRLQSEGLVKMEDLQGWQRTEREKLERLVHDNKLTVDDFEKKLLNDKTRLQQLATQYQVELKDLENWLRQESGRLQSLGLIQEEKLTEWQKIERDRLLALITKNDLSIGELEKKIKNDQVHLYSLAHQYSVRVEEIEEWLRKEVLRLQKQADLEAANLKGWQKLTRERLLQLVRNNDLTIDEFIRKINNDHSYLQQLANQYHVEVEEIEEWAKSEGNRFESLGLIKPSAPLTEWQEVERDHVLKVVMGPDQLTLDQLEERLKNDRAHLSNVAQSYKVQVQEIEEWIRKELQRLQNLGVVQIEQLKAWQQSERDRLTTLVAQQQNGFSVDEVERKLKADRDRLQQLAWQNNVQVKEIEEWIHKELQRMKDQGQNQIEKLTEWQKNERDRILILAQQQSDLTNAELEAKLHADRTRLQQLAQQYHVEVEEVEEWIRKEVQRLRDQGKLHIENLTAWQLNERDRLQQLIQQQSQLSVEEIEKQLKADHNRLQQLAWQYHIQVEEVEEWIRKEAQRLRNQGQLHIENLTDWQLKERQRLQELIQKNSDVTIEEFENKIKIDQGRLQNLAYQYHVNVEEIESWIKKEIQRLRDEGKLQIEKLTAWQQAEKDRLLQLAQQQSQLTLTEFEQKLTNDRKRLEALANQYHISVQEIEEWIRKEAERLENQGVIGNLQNWQKIERQRIQDLIKQHNTTFDEFKNQLKLDHNRLQQLAWQYHTNVEDVENWIINEGNRQFKPEALTVWQVHEQQRLQNLIQARDLSLEDLVRQVKSDRGRLQQLAQQYHVTVEEIEEWIISEGQKQIKPAPLTDWQRTERDRLIQIILKENLSIEELKRQLVADRARLQQLAWQNHVTVEEIQEWIIKEGQNLIKPVQLTVWQQNEHDRLVKLIHDQNLSTEDIRKQILNDRQRLQQLSRQYHVTIEEIEEWIIQEADKLAAPAPLTEWQQSELDRLKQLIREQNISLDQLKQQLQIDRNRLQQLAYQYHVTIEEIEEWVLNEGRKLIKPSPLKNPLKWQQHEREYLQALVETNLLTIKNFEKHLAQDELRMENVANHYQISVDEIVEFWRKEVQRLAALKQISEGEDVVEDVSQWKNKEQQYITRLLQEHDYSIEELERQLRDDREHLQQLANQYHVTIEEIEEWYITELQKLLQQKKIYSENLSDWQKREKERIYLTLKQQHVTIEELERQLAKDRDTLRRLAAQYHITIEQLINWQRNEIQRLNNLGYGKRPSHLTEWQITERKRLRAIPEKVIITKDELQEFFDSDTYFQGNLSEKYNVALDELKLFQGQELQKMKNEGVLESITLKHLEDWQRRERDRLYNLIRTQNFDLKKLKTWQTPNRMTMIASIYRIPADTLRNWQYREMQRIEDIARHYKISLNRMEDFRHGEIERLQITAHQNSLKQIELLNWSTNEDARLRALQARTGLSGPQLDKWRRKLFLLAQGLIDLDFNEGGYGGIELNTNTSASAKRNETVSKDRGDQPPQIYEEEFEESEPSLGGSYDPSASLVQSTEPPKWPPGHGHGHHDNQGNQGYGPPHRGYVPPSHGYGQPGYNYQAERIHRKKEFSFNVPAESPASDLGYQNRYSHGRGGSYADMESRSLTQNDQDAGQQQVQIEDWNPNAEVPVQTNEKIEDFRQQSEQIEDLGQQHVQQEILPEVHVDSHSSQTSVDASVKSTAEGPVVNAESVTEPSKSVWSKVKDSAKSWFG